MWASSLPFDESLLELSFRFACRSTARFWSHWRLLDFIFFVVIKLQFITLLVPINPTGDMKLPTFFRKPFHNILVVISCSLLSKDISNSLRRRINVHFVCKNDPAVIRIDCIVLMVPAVSLSLFDDFYLILSSLQTP